MPLPTWIAQILAASALTLWALALGPTLLGTLWARSHFRGAVKSAHEFQPGDDKASLEPISILKPVEGIESGLERNLTNFFYLDYPDYELLFSVADPQDPAVPLLEKLIDAHPRTPARLIKGDEPTGPNPKVRNLARSYREARHDWILVSDSNVLVDSNYLQAVARGFTKDVGVVTAIVRGSRANTLGGALESMYLNTFYARWMVICAHIGRDVVVGKSMLFRKSTAERFGGLMQLGRFLAEDQMAGEAMRMLGLKIRLMKTPVAQPLPGYQLRDFWSRHVRWGRIRRAQAPLPILFEPLLSSVLSGFIGAWGAAQLLSLNPWSFFAIHWLLWFLNDLYLSETLGEEAALEFAPVWAARELLAFPLWVQTISGRTVWWRGARLKVRSGGLLEGT